MKQKVNKVLKLILLIFSILLVIILYLGKQDIRVENFSLQEKSNTVEVDSITFNRGEVLSKITFNEIIQSIFYF